jgi:hypothetical protein
MMCKVRAKEHLNFVEVNCFVHRIKQKHRSKQELLTCSHVIPSHSILAFEREAINNPELSQFHEMSGNRKTQEAGRLCR